MKQDGKTIAVLGCGADVIFPTQNKYVYEKILESGGLIVSEYPSMTGTKSEYFRQRNRIVSGLAIGTLIVEAEIVSGTTITARFTKEQGKRVFCIPSAIDNPKGVGTNALIRKGATLVQSPADVIQELGEKQGKQITIEELENSKKQKIIDVSKIPEEYREMYKLLVNPMSVNDIEEKIKMTVTDIYSMLFMMELEGYIKKKDNKYVIR